MEICLTIIAVVAILSVPLTVKVVLKHLEVTQTVGGAHVKLEQEAIEKKHQIQLNEQEANLELARMHADNLAEEVIG